MPSVNLEFLKKLQDDYQNYDYFIETGTCNGDTILEVEPYFKKLYTIEISEKYYNNTKNKYNGDKINFILGDSSVVLNSMLKYINSKSIFFLDGHWSSGDTGRSDKDVPLVEEITSIYKLFKNEAIIIIDDFRLFGMSNATGLNEDWSYINKEHLLDILRSRINKVYHLDSELAENDRLVIHINSK